ncbi:MAG: PEP/pyruvate-binding domain-containing protein, partial [Candidatus Rokuibacteriota bacterium]
MRVILHASDDRLIDAWGGGKAKNLRRLERLGFDVPPWFCVSAQALEVFLRFNSLDRELPRGGALGEVAREVEHRLLGGRLPGPIAEAVAIALEGNGLQGHFVAVRSSGLDEDSDQNSFAGQFSSFLFRRGRADVLAALVRCWASAFSERALTYRVERGLPLERIRLGVVVQRMVDAEAAGVAFSRNPIHPLDRATLLISSVWGLGEGLVSGQLDADEFEVRRDTLEIRATVAEKTHAVRPASPGGVRTVEVPPQDRARASLTDEQAREVAGAALRLEATLGRSQDIEWAYERGRLYLLQTRPITHLPPDAASDPATSGPTPVLWDNSNIVESFCGVTSPLTFSHASRAYGAVYRQFCDVMGVPPRVVTANEPVFRNMLGLVRGRIYYNLVNWYRLLSLFPAASSSKSFMETMMGVKQTLEPELAALFDFPRPRYSPWRRLWLVVVSLWRYATIARIIGEFEAHLNAVYERFRGRDLAALSLQAQSDLYHQLLGDILQRWQAPIINDGRCMLAFGLLKRLTERWMGAAPETAALQNDLLCGQGDLPSTEPTRMLMAIAARVAAGDPARREWFLATPPAELYRDLGARAPEIAASLGEFLDRYGFRCVNELKLEEPDLHDDPAFALEAVASYVRMQSYSVGALEQREAEIRDKAEAVARTRLSGWRRVVYFRVLSWARQAVRDRERLRFARTRSFGLARQLFRAMGKNLVKLGVLRDTADVFYLTVDELITWVEGRAVTIDLGRLVELRRAEWNGYRRTPAPPDRFLTTGAAGAAFAYPQMLLDGDLLRGESNSSDPHVLAGTPCCPGVVENEVRVVRTMDDARGLRGQILVAERTDPGWVPLYPSCSGLLVERGSPLSHSAVVAR